MFDPSKLRELPITVDAVVEFLVDENFLPEDSADSIADRLRARLSPADAGRAGSYVSAVIPGGEVLSVGDPVYVVNSLTEKDAYVNGLILLASVLLHGYDLPDLCNAEGHDSLYAVVEEIRRDLADPAVLDAAYWGHRVTDFNERLSAWQLYVWQAGPLSIRPKLTLVDAMRRLSNDIREQPGIFDLGQVEPDPQDTCNCGRPSLPPHACPYQEEACGNANPAHCRCCEQCIKNCNEDT